MCDPLTQVAPTNSYGHERCITRAFYALPAHTRKSKFGAFLVLTFKSAAVFPVHFSYHIIVFTAVSKYILDSTVPYFLQVIILSPR